jgi:serine/threonine protein phosphatase PrpC
MVWVCIEKKMIFFGIIFSTQKKETMQVTCETKSFQHGNITIGSMQGRRGSMEDYHRVELQLKNHPHLDYFALFDGHCGDKTALYASVRLHHLLNESKTPTEFDTIKSCFKTLDEEVEKSDHRAHGSTVVMILVNNKTKDVITAHVGDSRAVYLNLDTGLSIELTRDHKPNNKEEKERIENRAKAYVWCGRVGGNLAVSRAIGDFDGYLKQKELDWVDQPVSAEPEISLFPKLLEDPEQRHVLLLFCDGLIEHVTHAEIVAHMQAGEDIISLMKYSYDEKRSGDNITAINIEYNPIYKYTKDETVKYDIMQHEFIKLHQDSNDDQSFELTEDLWSQLVAPTTFEVHRAFRKRANMSSVQGTTT